MELFNNVVNFIKNKIKCNLANQTPADPLTFFLFIAFKYAFLRQENQEVQLMFYFSAVTVYILFDYNIIYAFAPMIVLENVIYLSLILITCNQKWKILFLIFSILDQLSTNYNYLQFVLIGYLLLLCIQIYQHLPFNQANNVKYFVGFFTLLIYNIMQIIDNNLTVIQNYSLVGLLLLPVIHFQIRMQNIYSQKNIKTLSISLMLANLKYLQQMPVSSQIRNIQIKQHAEQCRNVVCFCRLKLQKNRQWFSFIKLNYQYIIQRDNLKQNVDVVTNYICFLMANLEYLHALYFINKIQPKNYLMKVAKWRFQAQIQKIIQLNDLNISENQQNQCALIYDEHCSIIRTAIKDILHIKISFWEEIKKQKPLLRTIQNFGTEILDKMYKLNQFYLNTIKRQQQKLYSINCSALYSTYLLSTTNLMEYAEEVINKISNYCEQLSSHDKNISEVFAIRAIIINKQQYQINHISLSQQLIGKKMSENFERTRNQNMLLIDKVSFGLCKVINRNHRDLIGCQISELIPNQYKQLHKNHLNQFLDFENAVNLHHTNIMHRQRKIPINGNNSELFQGSIYLKYMSDIKMGLAFISAIRFSKQESTTAIVDFNGKCTSAQNQFNHDVLEHRTIKYFLQMLREQWKKQKIIKQQSCTIRVKNYIYDIKIYSPFMDLFVEKQKEIGQPPFHIEIMNTYNDHQARFQTQKINLLTDLKKINYQSDKTSAVAANNKIKNITAVSSLYQYCQHQRVPFYKNISGFYFFIVCICLGTISVQFKISSLEWDNTRDQNNPIGDVVSLVNLSFRTIETVFTIADFNFDEWISHKAYMDELSTTFINLQLEIRMNLNKFHNSESNIISKEWSQLLSTQIDYYSINLYNFGHKTMSMTYNQLLMNTIIDLSYLNSKKKLQLSIIQQIFSQQVADLYDVQPFIKIIDQSIDNSLRICLMLGICTSILVCLIIVPLMICLKRRLSKHTQIYDMIVSVKQFQVLKQIKSLKCVINLLQNYDRQQEDIFKSTCQQLTSLMINTSISVNSHSQTIPIKNREIKRATSIIPTRKIIIRNQFQKHVAKQINKCVGEINYQNSQFAINKINIKNCVLYGLILVFLLFSLQQVIRSNRYMETIKLKKDKIVSINNKILDSESAFLIAKQYWKNGQNSTCKITLPNNYKSILKNRRLDPYATLIEQILQLMPFFNVEEVSKQSTNLINFNTTEQTYFDRSLFSSKQCNNFNYSLVILQGQFNTFLKNLLELRYSLDKNIMQDNYSSNTFEIKQKISYIYALKNEIMQNLQFFAKQLFKQMLAYSSAYEQERHSYFIYALMYAAFSLIFGLFLIQQMAKQFINEVYMLSFLNRQMIQSSKQIESYINLISKQIYEF